MRGVVIGGVAILICVIGGFSTWSDFASVQHKTLTINRPAERQCKTTSDGQGNSDTTCNWLVYSDGEVFEDEDDLLQLKFNSADVANDLRPGQTYCVKVNGYRIPAMSSFRNVLRIENPGACRA